MSNSPLGTIALITRAGSTDELVAGYAAQATDLDREDLELVIPAAIDAIYSARDAGGTMHDAGAAAAVRVLQLLEKAGRFG